MTEPNGAGGLGSKAKWWETLPPPEKVTTKFKGIQLKEKYTPWHRNTMIAYLVVNNLIEKGTSRKTWQRMIAAGYLVHRTDESLCNHYRRTILPHIESYRLPQEIERRFVSERRLHKASRRKPKKTENKK